MAHHHKASSWTERTTMQAYTPSADSIDRPLHSPAFKHPHTSLGWAGHVVHMAGIFVPVLAGEFIESPQKYKKVVRLASIGTAMAYEAIHVYNEVKRREKQEAKLAECQSRD